MQKTRAFTGVVMLAIGVSWTFNYYQLKELKKEFFENQTIVIQNPPLSNEVEVVEMEEEKTIDEKITDEFGENGELMLAIAKAESGLRSDAVNVNTNGSQDTGIFQINSIHGYESEELKDIDFNIKVAKKILASQGITAWSAYNNGSYKKFL